MKTILLPWLFFSLMSLVVHQLITGCSTDEVYYYIRKILTGNIRNQFLSGGLWFLTCLFVTQMLFFLIKQLRFRILILAVLFGIHIFAVRILGPTAPSKFFNYDSALLYIIYYGIGYLSFPYILRILETKTVVGRATLAISWVPVLYYAGKRYFSHDLLDVFYDLPYVGELIRVAGTLILIWLIFLGSKIMEDLPFLHDIGTNTLYLCGGEYFAKAFLESVLGLFGISITVRHGFSALLYALFLLLVANTVIVPIEKWVVASIEKSPLYFKKQP